MLEKDSIAPEYQLTTSEYIQAEQIRWHYNKADSSLDIIHFRKVSNCGCQWLMKCQVSGTTLFLEETNSGNELERCNCAFDLFCRIKISVDVNALIYADKKWPINLNDNSGTIIVDATNLSTLGITIH